MHTTAFRLTLYLSVLFLLPYTGVRHVTAAEKNIVFFITDDQSPTLGCYGDRVAKSPAIDALAADGLLFNNAFVTTASCSPSRSVVLSGLYSHKNGQFGLAHDFHKFASFDNVVSLSLPRVLANQGYRTARIGKLHVAPEIVYHFEETLQDAGRNVVQMAKNCEQFLTAEDERPFFLYFATYDPHRSSGVDETASSELKPNLFGNKANQASFPGVEEQIYTPAEVIVPPFMTDNAETREELAHYYQSCARIDQGLAQLVMILKKANLYDKTLIVFTSDHGMPFSGAKTGVYDPGLHVPFVVRNPYSDARGQRTNAMISHVDIAPSLLDFAGGLDEQKNAPIKWVDPNKFWKNEGTRLGDNRGGSFKFDHYQGKSWLSVLNDPQKQTRDFIFASHTFHEIQMYYPMRVYRDTQYKLIWNIAHPLPYPFASDLWAASSWQSQFKKGPTAPYGQKTVGQFIHRPAFELYDIRSDQNETKNLADDPAFSKILEEYKAKLKAEQTALEDPWRSKWDYE